MSDVFCDKYATGAGDGSSWEDAYTTIAAAISGSSSGDRILIASYGPDDAYVITTELVPAGQEFVGVESGATGTTVPDSAYVWITSSTDDVDIFDSTGGGTFRYIVAITTGNISSASVRGWNVDGSNNLVIDHCRAEATNDHGYVIGNTVGTDATLVACESVNCGKNGFVLLDQGDKDAQHLMAYSDAEHGIYLNPGLSAAGVGLRESIVAGAGTASVYVGETADFAAGYPDFSA